MIASNSPLSIIADQSLYAFGIDHWAATLSARSRSRPQTAVMRPTGWSASAGRYIASAHQLVPTSPTRTVAFSLMRVSLAGECRTFEDGLPHQCRGLVARRAETTVVEVDERLANFVFGVHHERAVASDRF